MPEAPRRLIRACPAAVLLSCAAALLAACGSGGPVTGVTSAPHRSPSPSASPPASRAASPSPSPTVRADGRFTVAVAGDVHFAGRIGDRLTANPATVFGAAQPGLAAADLTMVNLETAITDGHGTAQDKAFTFQAPPAAFTALREAGVDLVTMANNHGADYGLGGIQDTLRAASAANFPVLGIGVDQDAAFAPYRTTLAGTKVAIFAADQVRDETTLRLFSAGQRTPGVANAYDQRLVDDVRSARRAGYVVLVYLHWGVEYQSCPSADQRTLAARLTAAGAAAVVGTHAHVLQGAGWTADGGYVAYGLGNYLWWRSFGNAQDDNGVLTLSFAGGRVTAAHFAPAHLADSGAEAGVPVPAVGAAAQRIDAEWEADRQCAGLASAPPS